MRALVTGNENKTNGVQWFWLAVPYQYLDVKQLEELDEERRAVNL